MAYKLSDLLTSDSVTLDDFLLITDVETNSSRKVSFRDILSSIDSQLVSSSSIKTHIETETINRETAVQLLQDRLDVIEASVMKEGFASGFLYVNNLTGG